MHKPAPTDHPIHELLARRWSPRAFDAREVDNATLLSLFEAARWAPSSFNEQPWRFLVAKKSDAAAFERLLGVLWPLNQVWAKDAPVLVLGAARLHFSRGDNPNGHARHDLGQALASLTVEATSRGLVVHQMMGFDADAARAAYSIPEGFDAVTVAAIGYPGDAASLPDDLRERESAPRSRKPLGEILFDGEWEKPSRLLAG